MREDCVGDDEIPAAGVRAGQTRHVDNENEKWGKDVILSGLAHSPPSALLLPEHPNNHNSWERLHFQTWPLQDQRQDATRPPPLATLPEPQARPHAAVRSPSTPMRITSRLRGPCQAPPARRKTHKRELLTLSSTAARPSQLFQQGNIGDEKDKKSDQR